MKDGLIKKSIDASVEAKTKELTEALEGAVKNIEDWLQAMRHELFVKCPRTAAGTLQLLAALLARHAVFTMAHDAQLTALMRMQKAANEEYTVEEE